MKLNDKIIVVTGAASGIGRALATRFVAEGARTVVCSDRDGDGVRAVAADIGGVAIQADVSREADIQALIEQTERQCGPIDLFCSNAGIGVGGGAETPTEDWQRIWDINVMAHVWAARHLVLDRHRRHHARQRGCCHRLARRPMRSPNTLQSAWPNGWQSPTAIRASRSRSCAPRRCARP